MSTALSCPSCGHDDTKVTDSRPRWVNGVNAVYRRRLCRCCNTKFSTVEEVNSLMEQIQRQRLWDMVDAILALSDDKRALLRQLVGMLATK